MGRYALINNKTKKVVNVIEWDGIARWTPPENHFVVESDTAYINQLYNEDTKSFDIT